MIFRRKLTSITIVLTMALFVAACSASSSEIGDSGVTVAELDEAVEAFEEDLESNPRPTDSRDGVMVRANICDLTDGTVLSGVRRRTWVLVENENATPMSVTIELTFDDGGTAGETTEIEGAVGGEPASTITAFNEQVESDPSSNGEDCTSDIESISVMVEAAAPTD